MSDTSVIQGLIDEQRELHRKQLELLNSDDLKKKIEDYKYWSVQLPILKKELEALVGVPLVNSSPTSTPSTQKAQKGPKKGGRRLEDTEVESSVLNFFKARSSSKGVSAASVARELKKDSLSEFSLSTIQTKVSSFLKGDLLNPSPRFRNAGEKGASKWFLTGNE
jgi:hypothetical protein